MVMLAVAPTLHDDFILPAIIRARFVQVEPTVHHWDVPAEATDEKKDTLPTEPAAQPTQTCTDPVLLLARSGDREALGSISRTILQTAYRKARHIGLQPEDAEDIAQDVALGVLKNLDGITSMKHLRFYTVRAATNQVWNTLKKAARNPPTGDEDGALDSCPGREDDPAEIVANGDVSAERALLRRAMSRLSPKYAEVLELSMSGESVKDLAVQLGITEGNYYTRLCKARKALHAELELEGYTGVAVRHIAPGGGRKKASPDSSGEVDDEHLSP